MKRLLILLFLFCSFLTCDELKRIYLITMDSMDEHWQSIYRGANDALKENSKNLVFNWLSPDSKNNIEQLKILKNAIANKANVIIISANDPRFLNDTIKEASANGIKFIFVDSKANFNAEQIIQTDNYTAGKIAAKEMIKYLKEKNILRGNIGIISVNPYTQSLIDREKGFKETMEGEDYQIFSTRYSDGKVSRAKKECETLLKLDIVGLFSTNEGASKGASLALKEAKDKIVAISFDAPKNLDEFIKEGVFSATIKQNPYLMGYESMKSAIKLLNNQSLNKRFIDTGVEVISK